MSWCWMCVLMLVCVLVLVMLWVWVQWLLEIYLMDQSWDIVMSWDCLVVLGDVVLWVSWMVLGFSYDLVFKYGQIYVVCGFVFDSEFGWCLIDVDLSLLGGIIEIMLCFVEFRIGLCIEICVVGNLQ